MPNEPTSFRLSPEVQKMLKELESWLGAKRSSVVEQAIRKFHAESARTFKTEPKKRA